MTHQNGRSNGREVEKQLPPGVEEVQSGIKQQRGLADIAHTLQRIVQCQVELFWEHGVDNGS